MSGAARRAIRCADGRFVVPDNRWDLVAGVSAPTPTPSISVVIPYFQQPRQLALVLAALRRQTIGTDRVEVVVADDGSTPPLDLAAPDIAMRHTGDLSVTVVRQPDNGFRAAAARNLGAAASSGDVLCFLDADTVPEPGYLEHATRLPAVVPDALVVGRRRHADLSSMTPADLDRWWAGTDRPPELTEPQWLRDAYGWTENLLRPGWTGYRYVISAVMTCTREMFDAVGGFDESFVRYGGEDWELANRLTMAGAVLAHEPRAVAWHDGADWAGRDAGQRVDDKNAEALALAPLITEPAARTAGLRYRIPDTAARVCTDGHSPASLYRSVASIVGVGDVAVWLHGDDAQSLYAALGLEDSRVRLGPIDHDVLDRCRFVLYVTGRVVFGDRTLGTLTDRLGPGAAGVVEVTGLDPASGPGGSVRAAASRAVHRSRRRAGQMGMTEDDALTKLFGRDRISADDAGVEMPDGEPWLSW